MWGTATSSFQIEGSNDIDGKIESIWDEFCDRPNTIKNTDNAKIACDHYNRFNQDFSKHYHLGSFHQSQEMFEIPVNKKTYNSLSPAHQAILKNAAYAANSDNYFKALVRYSNCLLYTSPSPRDKRQSRMPSSA